MPRHSLTKPRLTGTPGVPRWAVIRLLLALTATLLLFASVPTSASASGDPGEPDAAERLIVRFDGQTSAAERAGAIRAADAQAVETLARGARAVVAADAVRAQHRLARDPRVDSVELDHPVTAGAAAPNDPGFGSLWGLLNTGQVIRTIAGAAGEDVGALDAWDRSRGADSIVAVLDTGTDLAIADLHANAWINRGELAGNGIDDDRNGKVDDTTGWSFTSDSPDIADDHGHGTHVAGTALAAADNGVGIAGVAPEARLMTVKVLGADGSGWTSDIADGFDYAARQGAQVVNASLGGSGRSAYLRDAIARHPDVLLVAAAGNNALDVDSSPLYPCAYDLPNVVCVASHDNTGALSSFSNFGDVGVDLAAPGRDIRSWVPGGTLAYMSGTSMATPHVAGAAALAVSAAPGTSPEALRDTLVATARRSAGLDGTTASGGALDVSALLAALVADGGSAPTVVSAPTLSGEPVVGHTLTAGGAAFDGATSTAWRWESCGTDAGDCQTVTGATGATLALTTGLRGRRVRAVAIASNAGRTTSAATSLTATIADPPPSTLSAPEVIGNAAATAVAAVTDPATAAPLPGRHRITVTGAQRQAQRGRVLVRVAGRSTVAGTVVLRICPRGTRSGCRTARAAVRPGRWARTTELSGRLRSARLTVRATFVTADGPQASIRRML